MSLKRPRSASPSSSAPVPRPPPAVGLPLTLEAVVSHDPVGKTQDHAASDQVRQTRPDSNLHDFGFDDPDIVERAIVEDIASQHLGMMPGASASPPSPPPSSPPQCYDELGASQPPPPASGHSSGDPATDQASSQPPVRRRITAKTRPSEAFGTYEPASTNRLASDTASANDLVTREAAAAARKRIRAEVALHVKRAKATRTAAWRSVFHEPSAICSSAGAAQSSLPPENLSEWNVHASHRIRNAPGAEILFCECCGAWSRGLRTRGLAAPCRRSCAHSGNLRLLRLGIAPVQGARVPDSVKKRGSRGTRGGNTVKGVKRRAKHRA